MLPTGRISGSSRPLGSRRKRRRSGSGTPP